MAGAETLEKLGLLMAELETVAARGVFQFKETLMSGNKATDPSKPRKVLGPMSESQQDQLQVNIKLITGGKRGRARIKEAVYLEADMDKAILVANTIRILWRVDQGQYDPLRLICAFTIRFKIIMRILSFRQVLEHLKELKKIRFPQSISPDPTQGPVKGILCYFSSGSVEASCILAYLTCELADGFVVCRLLAGKTRVAPKCKISIPRMDLIGALVAVRLYKKIQYSLNLYIREMRFFTDSSAVLAVVGAIHKKRID